MSSLPTVPRVDIERYAGRWYELARLPVRFQRADTVSTADYTVRPDGKVGVENTSWLQGEVRSRIRGTAAPVDGSEGARLRVKFGGLLRLIPTPKEGNYWVLDLQPDYSMALVGTPDRKMLWLLARDKDAWGTASAASMVQRASQLGFDTQRLQVADWQRGVMRPPGAVPVDTASALMAVAR